MARKTSEFGASGAPAAGTEFLVRQNGNKRLSFELMKTWIESLAGSGGDVIFATEQQAKDAISTTVASSPARVREYMEQYGITANFTNAKTNLNLSVRGEFFSWSDTTTNTPVAGSFGRGLTLPSGGGNLTQIGVENGTGRMYVRYQNANVFSPWVQIGASSGGGAGGPLRAVMPADDDGGSTNTTLKTVMTLQVEANRVYQLEGRLLARMQAATRRIRVALDGTAGTQTLTLNAQADDESGVLISRSTKVRGTALEFARTYDGDDNVIYIRGQIMTTSAGTITLRYSSGNGEYVSLTKGSSFTLQETGTVT